MIEIFAKDDLINIKNSNNTITIVDTINQNVKIDDYLLDFPGEYEKSLVLGEVKEYEGKLFYNLSIDTKSVLVVFYDDFELKEEIISFFGDVDILLIIGSKNSTKIADNIEAKVVIPLGEGKDVFLNTLGQHKEEEEIFKLKGELGVENTKFVNLKQD